MGYFAVSRGTLTGLLSTILTYMIILVQFDQTGQQFIAVVAANMTSNR